MEAIFVTCALIIVLSMIALGAFRSPPVWLVRTVFTVAGLAFIGAFVSFVAMVVE